MFKKEAILSLDIGTVNLKTLVITVDGRTLWLRRKNILKIKSPITLWQKILNEILKIPSQLRANIRAITITSHGPSYVVKTFDGKTTLEPYYKPIYERMLKYSLNFYETKLLSTIHSFGVEKIDWIMGLKEYVAYKFTNVVSYSKFELRTNVLKKHLGKLYSKVFKKENTYKEPVGYVRKSLSKKLGFRKEVYVIVAPTDAICSLIGVGCVNIGCASLNLGYTATLLNILASRERDEIISHLFGRKLSLKIDSVIIGHAVSFAKKAFHKHSSSRLSSFSLIIPMVRKGMLYRTSISAINIPYGFSYEKALETIVTTALLHLNFNLKDAVLKEIRLSGGLASSRIAKTVSNIFNTKTRVVENTESSALGASIIGISYLSREKISNIAYRAAKVRETYTPENREVEKYRKYMDAFRKIYETISQILLN